MKSRITYYWWVYVLYAFGIIAVSLTIFNALERPTDDERIQILFGGAGVSSASIEQDLQSYLLENSTQNIKEVIFETVDSTISSFPEILVARAISVGDLIILPESAIRQNTGETYFMPLDETEVRSIFGDQVNLYSENDIIYGIYLNQGDVENNFTSYMQENDENTYVLFFNMFSVNTGDWNEEGNNTDMAAIECAIWLMEEGEYDG